MSYLDIVMKIIVETPYPMTLNEIIEKDKRLNYDRVRSALTKASRKGFLIRDEVRPNGCRDRNHWYVTKKGKSFVYREKKSIPKPS